VISIASYGRPVIGKKKDCDIRVRIDSDLNDSLLEFCNENGMTRAEVIRKVLKMFLDNEKNPRTGK
jgi:metal-responsive CopG/Arc/MetJ family transcriptional regulator